jgi:hypothetical protein
MEHRLKVATQTMRPLPPFPDVERLVCELLADLATVGTETGTRLQEQLPFVQVVRVGGSSDRFTDRARIDVHIYAVAASEAKQLAETVRQRLLAAPITTSFGVIDRVVCDVGPQVLPPVDYEHLRRVVATYRVSMRRPT